MITENQIKSVDGVILTPSKIYLLASHTINDKYNLPSCPIAIIPVNDGECPYCGSKVANSILSGDDGGTWCYKVYVCGSMAATARSFALSSDVLLAISKPTPVCVEISYSKPDDII